MTRDVLQEDFDLLFGALDHWSALAGWAFCLAHGRDPSGMTPEAARKIADFGAMAAKWNAEHANRKSLEGVDPSVIDIVQSPLAFARVPQCLERVRNATPADVSALIAKSRAGGRGPERNVLEMDEDDILLFCAQAPLSTGETLQAAFETGRRWCFIELGAGCFAMMKVACMRLLWIGSLTGDPDLAKRMAEFVTAQMGPKMDAIQKAVTETRAEVRETKGLLVRFCDWFKSLKGWPGRKQPKEPEGLAVAREVAGYVAKGMTQEAACREYLNRHGNPDPSDAEVARIRGNYQSHKRAGKL